MGLSAGILEEVCAEVKLRVSRLSYNLNEFTGLYFWQGIQDFWHELDSVTQLGSVIEMNIATPFPPHNCVDVAD